MESVNAGGYFPREEVGSLAFSHNVQGEGEHLPAACLFSARYGNR